MKKGFTLIELLAVIVILAIIALIATPIVLNIINDSKESSLLRSAEFYLDAAEYTIADTFLDGAGLESKTYPITPDGDICIKNLPCDLDHTLKVEVNGEKPSGGNIVIEKGKIVWVSTSDLSQKTTLIISGNTISYDSSKKELVIEKQDENDIHKEEVKLICKASTEKKAGFLASESRDKFSYGVTYTCDPGDGIERIFYVLEASEDSVALIMDNNIVSDTKWLGEGKGKMDENEPEDALAALKAQTTDKGWTVPVDIPTNIQLNAASDGANELPEFLIDNIGVGTERFEYNSYWTTSWSINYDECFEQSSTCTEEYDWDCYCISPGINANIVKPIYEDGEGFIKLGEIIEQNAKYGSGVRPVITVPKNQIG